MNEVCECKAINTNKISDIAKLIVFLGILFGCMLWGIIKSDDDISEAERRPLASKPEVSVEAVWNGRYMRDFEQYAMDQFPMRDGFRSMKAWMDFNAYRMQESNGLYVIDGSIAKLEYKLNEASITHAAERFGYIYDTYLSANDTKVYVSVIPDKGYYLAEESGYPVLDYALLKDKLMSQMSYAVYIDIAGALEASDYYRTDTHWRQERILGVALILAESMDADISRNYICEEVGKPFYGVYYGQLALKLEPDDLYYVESEQLSDAIVYDYERESYIPMYDMPKAESRDAYELYLGGPKSLLRIENPDALTDKRLVVFRDSFASSLAPYLSTGYSEIILVDIRYIQPELLGQFIEFDGQDVLYLYSGPVLNNSETIK